MTDTVQMQTSSFLATNLATHAGRFCPICAGAHQIFQVHIKQSFFESEETSHGVS